MLLASVDVESVIQRYCFFLVFFYPNVLFFIKNKIFLSVNEAAIL